MTPKCHVVLSVCLVFFFLGGGGGGWRKDEVKLSSQVE